MRQRDIDVLALDRFQTEYRQLLARMSQLGFIWNGSVCARWLTCGRPDCACAHDPAARHGPYLYWTTKVKGRTVTKLLHPPESIVLTEWVRNRQEVDKIIEAMRKISQKAFKTVCRLVESDQQQS